MTLLTQKNKRKNTGFTLIELIVTISVVAILASIAIPNYTSLIRSNSITAATNELVSSLLLARSEALKRSNTVSVCISNVEQDDCSAATEKEFEKGWLVFLDCNNDGALDSAGVDCDNDGVNDDADQIIKIHSGVKTVNLQTTSGASSFIKYSFSGRSDAQTFDIRHITNVKTDGTKIFGSVIKKVIISRTGRVRAKTL